MDVKKVAGWSAALAVTAGVSVFAGLGLVAGVVHLSQANEQPALPSDTLTCATTGPGYVRVFTAEGSPVSPGLHVLSLRSCSWTYTSAYVAGQGTSSWSNPPTVVTLWSGQTKDYPGSDETLFSTTPLNAGS